MSEEEFDFEEQIRLEAEERKKAAQSKTKVDEDGTEYEWDEAKQAWFPKIDANFIAQYQMNYGNFEVSKDPKEEAEKKDDSTVTQNIPPAPPVDHPGYYYWYYHVYLPSQQESSNAETKTDNDSENISVTKESENSESVTKTKSDNSESVTETKSDNSESVTETKSDNGKLEEQTNEKDIKDTNETSTTTDSKDSEKTDGDHTEGSDSYDESYKKYCEWYYSQQGSEDGSNNSSDWSAYYEYYKRYYDQDNKETERADQEMANDDKTEAGDGENDDKSKKAKKRKEQQQQQKDQGWFEMDQSRSTSVYVSNLPHDITDEEFKELMAKYGLIAMDPVAQKLKLKLYRNKDGEVKGDGLCSYIKMESVDLALDILDGYRLRDYEISVELAKFEMKGSYDPSKKKKKLTNKEKRKLKEKQEKLFDWKLDKAKGIRNTFEKTLVFKNVFDPTQFEANPALIFQLRDKLKQECSKYGTVRKVVVYDRHQEKVAIVTFSEVEEADVCRQQMDNRCFNQQTIQVDAWDGKTKYTVKESEEQEKKRLNEWGKFLQEGESLSETKAESNSANAEQSTVADQSKPIVTSDTVTDQPAAAAEASSKPPETSQPESAASAALATSAAATSEQASSDPLPEAMDTSDQHTPDPSMDTG